MCQPINAVYEPPTAIFLQNSTAAAIFPIRWLSANPPATNSFLPPQSPPRSV